MELPSLALIVGGTVAVVIGVLQVRGPLATIRHLDQTEANLSRYESWRGKQTGPQAEGPTGADIMRAQMRQRVMLWAGLIGGGILAVILGLAVR